MPQPLYAYAKSPKYLLGRRLGRLQSWSGHDGEEKDSQPPAKNGTPEFHLSSL